MNRKLLLTIGIGLFIVILYIAIIIYPQTSNILKYNNGIYNEKIELAQLNIKEKDLKKFKDKEKEINFILDQLSAHLIREEDILDFIIQLEEIAKKTNNKQEINIQQEEKAPKAQKTEDQQVKEKKEENAIKAKIKLIGDFNSLINYLIELEKANILSDQLSLNSQLAGLTQVKTNIPFAEPEEIPKENELITEIEINIFLAN